MSPTIRHKYKYFHSTVQGAKDRRKKFHFCRLPSNVRPRNFKLNLSIIIFSTRKQKILSSSLIPEISPWSALRSHEETNVFKTHVIDQIFSLTRDCLKPITWLNILQLREYRSDIPQFSKLRVLRKLLKDNKHNSFHLVRNMLGYLS